MRVPLLIGLCAVMAASAAFAGGVPNTGMGAKQMVFSFSGLSDLGLGAYEGGFGFRYFYSDDTGIRGMLNFSYEKDEYKVGGTTDEETYTSIGAALVWEKYMAAIASVAPYMGIGLGYNYSKEEEPFGATTTQEWTGNEIFVPLVAGFQWYFTEALSLGGEYRLSYSYTSGKWTTTEPGFEDEETTISEFGFSAASVFFAVHY